MLGLGLQQLFRVSAIVMFVFYNILPLDLSMNSFLSHEAKDSFPKSQPF